MAIRKFDLLGESYPLPVKGVSSQRTINYEVQQLPQIQTGFNKAKTPIILRPTHGMKPQFIATNSNRIRGSWVSSTGVMGIPRVFTCENNEVYTWDSALATKYLIGRIDIGAEPVKIMDDGFRLLVLSKGIMYWAPISADENSMWLNVVSMPEAPGTSATIAPTTMAWYKQRIWVNTGVSRGQFVFSDLPLGEVMPVFNSDNFYTAESLPDVITGLASADGSLWVIGSDSYEVWRSNDDQDDPLTPIGGNSGEIGCQQPNSIAVIDNTVYFLGASKLGVGGIYAGNGTNCVRISNAGIDYLLSQLTSLNCVGFTFGADGCAYYQLSFIDSGSSLLYSKDNGWSEKVFTDNEDTFASSNLFPFVWQGKLFSGCLFDNGIYEMDRMYPKDYDGSSIKRTRIAPVIANDVMFEIIVSNVVIDIETGTTDSLTTEPQMLIRVSRDGGNTWKPWRSKGLGKQGNYRKTISLDIGGASKALVYEIVIQDTTIAPTIYGARIDYTQQSF